MTYHRQDKHVFFSPCLSFFLQFVMGGYQDKHIFAFPLTFFMQFVIGG